MGTDSHSATVDANLIRSVEEMCITAWPSFRQILTDGWIVRLADGYTFRANSVQPIYPGSGDVSEKIAWCEGLYSSVGLPTAFKVTPVAEPDGLDSLLESQGYRVHTPTSVQVLDALPKPAEDLGVECTPIGEWLDAFADLVGLAAEKQPLHARIVESIPLPVCTLLVKCDDRPVACGLGVLQGEYVGIYDVYTASSMRRAGLATRIMSGILSWAHDQGATKSHLSVLRNNTPAITLYEKLGFRHIYSYWYRIKD